MKHAPRWSLITIVPLMFVSVSEAQNAITEWNTIASNTIIVQGNKASDALLYFAYTSIAVYDATNSINQKFRPFYYSGRTDGSVSEEAAAVSAAHSVLVHYFSAQKTALDALFQESINKIAAPPNAIRRGVAAGVAAADALIAARTGDGLEADVPYLPGTAPGDWQPTLPLFLPAANPWVAQMRPFTMKKASQFLPRGPYPSTSEQWAADYNLTRLFGELHSTVRTAGQTEIGLFWTELPFRQYARAWNYLAQNQRLNVLDSARLFAMLWTGFSDALIGCFNAKYEYSFWRPVTAIQAGGANAELNAEPSWIPLGTTPNHPEYPAAHACGTSALSNLVADFFGTQKVHVVVDSLAFTDGVHTHTFENTADWLDEVFWARIYAGFHFRHSLEDGAELGRRVSRQLFNNYFQKIEERHEHFDDER